MNISFHSSALRKNTGFKFSLLDGSRDSAINTEAVLDLTHLTANRLQIPSPYSPHSSVANAKKRYLSIKNRNTGLTDVGWEVKNTL